MVHDTETQWVRASVCVCVCVCVCVTSQVNEGNFIMESRRLNPHFHIVATTIQTSDVLGLRNLTPTK